MCGMNIKPYTKHMFWCQFGAKHTNTQTNRRKRTKNENRLSCRCEAYTDSLTYSLARPLANTKQRRNLYDPNYWINGWMKMVHKNVTWAWNFATWNLCVWVVIVGTDSNNGAIIHFRMEYNFLTNTPFLCVCGKEREKAHTILTYHQKYSRTTTTTDRMKFNSFETERRMHSIPKICCLVLACTSTHFHFSILIKIGNGFLGTSNNNSISAGSMHKS